MCPIPPPLLDRLVGPFQQQVLCVLARTARDTSARDIVLQIAWLTGRWASQRQVHMALDRLAARGYVTSWKRGRIHDFPLRDARPGPRWPLAARRFVSLTVSGRRALRLSVTPVDELRAGLPGLGQEGRLYRFFGPPRGWTTPRGPLKLRGRSALSSP